MVCSIPSFKNLSFVGHSFRTSSILGHPGGTSQTYLNRPRDCYQGSRKAAIPYSNNNDTLSKKCISLSLKAVQNLPYKLSLNCYSAGSVYKSLSIVRPATWNLGVSLASR